MDDLTCGLALQYGNPGPATYSSANQEWHYARNPRPCKFALTKLIEMTETNILQRK